MEFRLLGPFEVTDAGGRVVDAGRPAQRALLALLLLNANRVVPLRTICDGLWGDEPPRSAANSVQVYISRLRKILGADLPLTMASRGYRLEVPPETIDVVLFERLAADGGSALERGDPAAAVITLRAALDLRRGPPLAEFAEIPFASAECARMNRLVRLAEENHAEARLAAGQHRELVGDLERLVELDPFSERCWGLLMTALYRCGRQADALAAYQRARRILIEQLGIEPGPELSRIEAAVLAQSLAPTEAQVSSMRGQVNLPSRAASFVGRDREVAELEKLMATARLVMLTGPGGCGKTSLAIALARATAGSYADGLWFVDLAPLGSPDQVPGGVCNALGVRQPPGRTLVQTAAEYVGHQNALVILDNCEHVLEASREVAEAMLRAGPAVKVLATSREHSGLPGEVIWQVPPLADSDAVRLFTERAESALPSFRLGAQSESVVNGICRRLDCIPLAIELAAARVSALSPEQIAARMDDALGFLGRRPAGAIARQRTLRATLDWSYDLLSVSERRLLARLAVFAGGFTLEAVEAVGPCHEVPAQDVVDLFTRLVDKSLVTRVGSAETEREPRYRLLEAIRQYAWARLAEQDGDEAASARSEHAACYLELAEKIEPNLYLAGSRPWFDRADAEHDNFSAALEWAFGGGPDAEIGPRLVAALAWAWFIDGRIAEGRAWADHALAVTDGQRTLVRGRALLAAAALASAQSDLDHQAQLASEAISLGDELGSAFLYAAGLDWLGLARWAQGNLEEAVTLLEKAAGLHGSHGNKWYGAACSAELGRALADSGRLGEARQMLDLGVRRARRLGEDAALGFTLDARALFALKCGELDTAAEIIGEAVSHYRASGYLEGLASGLNTQAFAAIGRGDPAAASASLAEALAACRRLGHLGGAATALAGLARVADMTGDAVRAAEFCAAAAALRSQAGAGLAGPEQASLDELAGRLAAQLGPAAFGDAWASGQAIRLDQAQELAGQH
jgi:predicted ATPase/DNA-binding SARP family transcriptional activator